MRATGRSEDRRRVGRPQNGDTKPCPKCAASICDFNARYLRLFADLSTLIGPEKFDDAAVSTAQQLP